MKRLFLLVLWTLCLAVTAQAQKVYQIENSDFEEWGTTWNNVPFGWHSFEDPTGDANLIGMIKSTAHTAKETENLRPGTKGSSALLLKPRNVFLGIIANGTITTGQMCGGSMSASDPANHAEMTLNDGKTSNGSPFYAALNGKPDSLVVWLKFTSNNTSYPNASVSAAITDGTYYQDPEDKTYTNVYAKAKKTDIVSNGSVWQRISIPFVVANANVEPKAILVTISTNAEAGKGNVNDKLYLDDLELVYRQSVTMSPVKSQNYYYATMCSPHQLVVPAGATAYPVTVEGGAIKLGNAYSGRSIIPANTPVLVRRLLQSSPVFRSTLYDTPSAAPASNMLQAGGTEVKNDPDHYYYKLSLDQAGERLGFFWDSADGHSINVAEGKAYLKVPVSAGAAKSLMLDDSVDGIRQVENGELKIENSAVYDLSGRKVGEVSGRHGSLPLQLQKGIYIVNGKKVAIH